jgi:hydrogenase nickel incorporation protein HypA/HybF
MHEMGIANSILDAVRTELSRFPGAHPSTVGVRIGEMTAIDQESLRFCLEALAKGTSLEGMQLKVESCQRRHRCQECNREFAVRDYDFECPDCHIPSSECVSGDELELAYVEIEEDEPSTVGTKSSQ